jgi:hypothetical protein
VSGGSIPKLLLECPLERAVTGGISRDDESAFKALVPSLTRSDEENTRGLVSGRKSSALFSGDHWQVVPTAVRDAKKQLKKLTTGRRTSDDLHPLQIFCVNGLDVELFVFLLHGYLIVNLDLMTLTTSSKASTRPDRPLTLSSMRSSCCMMPRTS